MISNAAERARLKAIAKTKAKVMNISKIDELLVELKQRGIDETKVAELTNKINTNTDKNQAVLNVINDVGKVADTVIEIVSKF